MSHNFKQTKKKCTNRCWELHITFRMCFVLRCGFIRWRLVIIHRIRLHSWRLWNSEHFFMICKPKHALPFKLITSLNRIFQIKYQNMKDQLLPNSDIKLYWFVLKMNVFVMDEYLIVFVYSVQNIKSINISFKLLFV